MQAPETRNSLPTEIGFLAEAGVDLDMLCWAARRARYQGVGADELLIAEGLVTEDFYYRALARRLNCPCLDGPATLAPGFDYRAALRASVARADSSREAFDWVLSPRGRQVAELLAMPGAVRRRIAICAPKNFSALVREAGRRALADDAAYALSRAEPRLSACAPQLRWSNFFFIIVSIGLIAGVMAAWRNVFDIVSLILSSLFYGGIYVRLCATAASSPDASSPQTRPLRDSELPSYTIIAPMHREAAVAAQFVAALRALDYPALGSKLTKRILVNENR